MFEKTGNWRFMQRQQGSGRRAFRHLAMLAGTLGILLIMGAAAGAADALANYYDAMLAPGMTSIQDFGVGDAVTGGFVWGADSWTAPSGESFNGFAYTFGSFGSYDSERVGGVSAGFGADGTANQPSLVFPWTDDCSITNMGHYWTNSIGTVASVGRCNTSGDSGGWNYQNIEAYNTDPYTNPQIGYGTLWLTVFCQAANCSGSDNAGVVVDNLSGFIDDSQNQPNESLLYWSANGNPGEWYQTDSNKPELAFNALDPSGVCYLQASLTGPQGISSGDLVGAPATTDPGAPIGNEFASSHPCDGSENYGWALPSGIASGIYNVSIQAANAGNYADQGYSGAGSPTIGTYNNAIAVDDVVPSLGWAGPSAGWTSSSSEDINVTVGPSGLRSLICTDNGATVNATLVSGSTSGAGTSTWNVPTATNGPNVMSCTATNNDVNGALTGGSAAQTFNVDDVTPTLQFADSGYTSGTWTDASQTVTIGVSAGPSGLERLTCRLDGTSVLLNSSSQITISGDGKHALGCTASSEDAEQGTGTYNIWIDTRQPTNSFLVNGSPPSGSWLNGTPVVQVIGSEAGGMLSGISKIVCTVTTDGHPDPGSPVTLSPDNGGLANGTGSFLLSTNGPNVVSCTTTNAAGTIEGTPDTITVNVDNPNNSGGGSGLTQYGSSGLIDDGADPYSNGPSQTSWHLTPQGVTITANDTGGPAPISGITCKGALNGSWPINNLNTDAVGGEQITVYVQPPGGELSCTAADSAGNMYPLGGYNFQIDATAPTGHFVAQSRWPQPNEVEVDATDNGGSGIAFMRLYATNSAVDDGAPQDLGQMTYDPTTGYYRAVVPDGVAPFTSGTWTFFVNDGDIAGNTGQITAGPSGGDEQVMLPLLEDTQITAQAGAVAATEIPAVPAAAAASAGIDIGTPTVQAAASSAHRAGVNGQARMARLVTGASHFDPAAAHLRRSASCPSRPSGVRRGSRLVANHDVKCSGKTAAAGVLTLGYGRSVTLRGVLTNIRDGRRPVASARILVYQRISGTNGYMLLGRTYTNAAGQYSYRVPAGASREIYVIYPGSRLLRPASSDLRERFSGSLGISVSQIHAGGLLVIHGRVRGGHIPAGGVNVTIDYRQAGAPGSGTLGTVRTNAKGEYRFTQPFAVSNRGLVYLLWAVVKPQPGWPYASAKTPAYRKPVL